MAKKIAYISSKPMTQEMVDLCTSRLRMDLVPVHHVDEFSDEPVKLLTEWDKNCRDVATDSPALAVALRSGLTKYGITVFSESAKTDGESSLDFARYYTREGMHFDLPA